MEGLIVKLLGGSYEVETLEGIYTCRARGKFRKNGESPVVGDRVTLTPLADGTGTVDTILPRKNKLRRPPVANLDQLFLVVSTREPVPNLLMVDKLLTICEHQGIVPVVVFTKADLAEAEGLADIYQKAGYPVLVGSPEREDFVAEARTLLAGKVSAFTGNTGVGKSTFLNRICPEFGLETGEISQKLGRGRHTTRHVELYKLPNGGYVADTPGFGAMEVLQYDVIRKEELQNCFPEFAPYVEHCRFTGCSHTKEKGCAVLAALKDGEIAPSRHENYCVLYEEAKQIKEWELK